MAVATHPAGGNGGFGSVGSVGLLPTLAAVKAGKNLALANKEALVMAGEILVREIRDHGVSLLPIDSEHSAIFRPWPGTGKKKSGESS